MRRPPSSPHVNPPSLYEAVKGPASQVLAGKQARTAAAPSELSAAFGGRR